MAPATAKPKAASLDRKLIEDGDALHEAVRNILRSCESPTDVPDPSDLAVLRLAGINIDDPSKLQMEIARELRAMRLESDAGTPAEFSQAQAALGAAVEREASQRPELETRISEAQRQLADLEELTKVAKQRVDGMTLAREQLRDQTILPAHIRDRWNQARRHVKSRLGARVVTLEGRIVSIDLIAKLDPTSREAMLYAQTQLRDALVRSNGAIESTAWDRHIADVKAEQAEAKKELAPLRKQLDADLAEADKLRNFYVDQL